jgi:hypothetical protein
MTKKSALDPSGLKGHTVGTLWIAALFLFTSSCSEPISPGGPSHSAFHVPTPKRLSHDMQSLPPVSKTLPAEPGPPISLDLYPFAEGILVDITISGNILLTSHSLAAPLKFTGELDYLGNRLPNDNGCLLQATVVFSQVSGVGNPFPNATACTTPRTMTNYFCSCACRRDRHGRSQCKAGRKHVPL